MAKYLKISLACFKFGLMWILEYRLDFLAWALVGVFWASMFVISADLLFGQVREIAGWARNEGLLVVSMETIFVGFLWIFVFPNLENFSRLIRLGELDFYLTKPVNTRFLVSTKIWTFGTIVRIILITIFMTNLIISGRLPVSFFSVLYFLFFFVCGLVIFYNIFFSFTVVNIWFINLFNLLDFYHNIMDMGRFPVQIYRGLLQTLFIYLLPIAYIATFPVQALLGKLPFVYFPLALFLVIMTSFLSQKFWNFALKHYSSASS